MKKTIIYFLFAIIISFTACESDMEMYVIQDGTPSTLVANIAPSEIITLVEEIADSVVYELSWTIVDYLKGDTSSVLADYVIEFSTPNVSEPVIIHPPDYLHYEFIGSQINTMLIEKLGGVAGEPIEASFKIVSTFNNDVLHSNTVTNTFTPYSLIPPPAVFPPDGDLYISGEAAGNPWPLQTKFTQVTETLYTLTTFLQGGKKMEFVTLGWNQAYKLPGDVDPNEVIYTGTFVEDGNLAHDEYGNEVSRWEGQKFISPPNDGTYIITLDFQTGIYTIESEAKPLVYLPAGGDVYIYGKAVGSPWPIPEDLKLIKESETVYSIVQDLIGGESYYFIADAAWDQAYKLPANVDPAEVITEGTFVEDGDKAHDASGNEVSRWEGQNFLAPAESGTYKLTLNFQTATYTVEKQE